MSKSREDAVKEIMESGETIESDEQLTERVNAIVNGSENGVVKAVRAFRINPTLTARDILDDIEDKTGLSRDDVIDLALRLLIHAPREAVDLAHADLMVEKRNSVLSFWK